MLASSRTPCGASLNHAEEQCPQAHAHMMIIGILPTLTERDLDARRRCSANPRYKLLNEQIFAARGEDLQIAIAGVERLAVLADTIAPEAACTSVQLHQQVDPEAFAAHWNAAQAIAGRRSSRWGPTRRSSSAASCGARPASRSSSRRPTRAPRSSRPRACARACGSASAGSRRSSISSRRTSATSRRCCRCATTRTQSRCSSAATLRSCTSCGCTTARSTAGTAPIYEVARGRPHLRVENRVLPAGPTVVDILANAAFYYGLVRALAEDERPVWSQM